MPIINNELEDNINIEQINQILAEGGIPQAQLEPSDQFKGVLNRSGASVENAAATIADVMISSKFDNSRLKAAEIALDLHGIRDQEGKVKKQPIFQFVIKDSSVNIAAIFSPFRDRQSLQESTHQTPVVDTTCIELKGEAEC